MRKLVRDKIPEMCQNPNIKIIKDDLEYLSALHKKLLEEANEFIEASAKDDNENSMQEIADILEVIDTICKFKKYNFNVIQDYKKKKKQEKGGFEKRILLKLD